ncbi:TIR domain-containing protein [Streptomyces sp. YS-B37]|uniref:TIR domain-containing protein n=1 Tax=Streptomyces sp. YS-B37 TaxID=3407669 RepID=UPI003B515143
MYDAFISYSQTDSAWAEMLHGRLRRFRVQGRPLSLFYAPTTIAAGQSIPRVLSQALEQSHHLIAIVTPAWLASEWCGLEYESSVWLDPGASATRLIPLLLKDAQLPPALARLKYVDFRNPDDFENGLRNTAASIRSGIVQRLQESLEETDREAVLNAPLLPWMGPSGPSFDFLWPEMFVDPPIRLHRHPGPETRLSDWLASDYRTARRTYVILGEPGSGKSTAMRSMLLNGGDRLPGRRTLVHARDLVRQQEALVRRSNESEEDLAVLVDGLDEAGSASFNEVATALTRLARGRTTLVIASRGDFFERNFHVLQEEEFHLHEVLEMKAWAESDVTDFARKYAERLGDPAVGRAVDGVLRNIPGAGSMISNPMRLTLLLFLLAVGTAVDATSLREPFILYRLFYDEWIRKEKQRRTTMLDFEVIRRAHVALARWLYENRSPTGASRDDLQGVDDNSAAMEELFLDSAFVDLLTFQEDAAGNISILSFRHETIGEFLIAQDILHSFAEGDERIDEGLRLTVGDDVNRFVRSGMNELSMRSVRSVLSNLTSRYSEILTAGSGGDVLGAESAQRIREQILYYVGRLPLTDCPDILRQAYENETSALNRRAAALGAILQGELGIESSYLQRLKEPEEDQLNRSVQLVYFGDVRADMHSYVDRGGEWSRVRAEIFRRLCGTTLRDERLRWWDLRTLRSFYRSRDFQDSVNEHEAEILAELSTSVNTDTGRERAVANELRCLRQELGLSDDSAPGP